jgi:hypothetical protein
LGDLVSEIRPEVVDWIELVQDAVQRRGLEKNGNETSGSIKDMDYLDQLNGYQLLEKDYFTKLFTR